MTILYADDDGDDRVFVSEAFKKIDPEISCMTVCDGLEAIDTLQQIPKLPDFIFLDVNMPIMDGRDCLIALKKNERYKHIPVIIYSTITDPRVASFYYETGAAFIVDKPYNFTQLCDVLRSFLRVAVPSKEY
jgi:CheY-like chemotaxis protein